MIRIDIARVAAPLLLVAGAAFAADKPGAGRSDGDYGRNLISVVTTQRHDALQSANCVVWANAEGLGVGPTELGGLHGLAMTINPKPLATEAGVPATTVASALPGLKAQFPKAPPWLFATLEKHAAAADAACLEDHEEPFTIHKITAADRRSSKP